MKLMYDGVEVKPKALAECLNISILELMHKVRQDIPLSYNKLPISVVREKKIKRESGNNYAGRIPFEFEIIEEYNSNELEKNQYRVNYYLEGELKPLEEIAEIVGCSRQLLDHKFLDVKKCIFEGRNIEIVRLPKNANLYDVIMTNGDEYNCLKVAEASRITGTDKSNITSVKLENEWIYRKGYKIRRVLNSNTMAEIFLKRVVEFWGKDKVMEYIKGLK
jgi:hypothetical protein